MLVDDGGGVAHLRRDQPLVGGFPVEVSAEGVAEDVLPVVRILARIDAGNLADRIVGTATELARAQAPRQARGHSSRLVRKCIHA